MGALICKARVALLGYGRGHDWRPLLETNHLNHGAPARVCIRCKENGWLV